LVESVFVGTEEVVDDEDGETGLGVRLHADAAKITRALRIAADNFMGTSSSAQRAQ
jgi:hypothetical protein